MTPRSDRRREPAAVAIAAGLGLLAVACAVAGALGDTQAPGFTAAAVFAALAGVMLWPGRIETAVIIAGGDVRQQEIDFIALVVAHAVLTLGLGGWLVVALVTGDRPWLPAGLLFASLAAYVLSVEILRRRM